MLSKKQLTGIENLLTCTTQIEAAQRTGVTTRTFQRWMKNPEFVERLQETERQRLAGVGRSLIGGQKLAVETLINIMTDRKTSDTNKRLAAVAWLELTIKWRELVEFEERLTRLENAIR